MTDVEFQVRKDGDDVWRQVARCPMESVPRVGETVDLPVSTDTWRSHRVVERIHRVSVEGLGRPYGAKVIIRLEASP